MSNSEQCPTGGLGKYLVWLAAESSPSGLCGRVSARRQTLRPAASKSGLVPQSYDIYQDPSSAHCLLLKHVKKGTNDRLTQDKLSSHANCCASWSDGLKG